MYCFSHYGSSAHINKWCQHINWKPGLRIVCYIWCITRLIMIMFMPDKARVCNILLWVFQVVMHPGHDLWWKGIMKTRIYLLVRHTAFTWWGVITVYEDCSLIWSSTSKYAAKTEGYSITLISLTELELFFISCMCAWQVTSLSVCISQQGQTKAR